MTSTQDRQQSDVPANFVGVLTESRGSGGDAVYSRVEQLVEAGAGRSAARDVAGLAPENEPPLTSAQDLIRQVCVCVAVLPWNDTHCCISVLHVCSSFLE